MAGCPAGSVISHIIPWKLSPTMGASDVTETLDQALAVTGVDQVKVKHRPRLLNRAWEKLEIVPERAIMPRSELGCHISTYRWC